MPKPSAANNLPRVRASSYHFEPGSKRAEPKKVTVFLKPPRTCQPSKSGAIMKNTRQCSEDRKSSGSLKKGSLEAGRFIVPTEAPACGLSEGGRPPEPSVAFIFAASSI